MWFPSRFDLVTNYGKSSMAAISLNVFKVAHDLARRGAMTRSRDREQDEGVARMGSAPTLWTTRVETHGVTLDGFTQFPV